MRGIIDMLISIVFVIAVVIVITDGFQFYIGEYLINGRAVLYPIIFLSILSVVRVLLYGRPKLTVRAYQLKGFFRQCLDLLALLFAVIALFIFLSGGIQVYLGDHLVSARSLSNPLIILLVLLIVRSWIFGIPLLTHIKRQFEKKWTLGKWLAVCSSLACIALVFGAGKYWFMKQGSLVPPAPGISLIDHSIKATKDLPRGFVVWGSNRFGNHDILAMELPSKQITRLTKNAHTEYFPRISPDGSKIVFSRSQRPWVSQRNQFHWDVILLDLKSGKQRLLAKNANTPIWSVDGKKIYYQRNGYYFAEFNLDTGKERDIFASGSGLGQVRKGALLQTPHYLGETNQFAVTLRRTQHVMGIVGFDGKLTPISDGCQLTWSKKGDFLYYVDYGGRKKNALYVYDPVKKKSRQWLDLPGELSHEYFPKLSNDEKYLVFGASEGGRKHHEHDTGDFELFLWKINTPADKAVRLTFHTGNDTWPDVFLY